MAGLQYVDHPDYAGLIIRRTYQDLAKPGALMDRAGDWLRGTGAHWTPGTATWQFPEGGSLTFGYIRTDADLEQYQSAEFQYIAWDELTQFTLHQYRFMGARLRRLEGSPTPLRIRAGTNPGGRGHEWVKERWRLGSKYEGMAPPDGRRFVPARLEDNPHLDQEAYEEALAELDPVLREQLRHGNWDMAYAGNMFKRRWFPLVDHGPLTEEPDDWDADEQGEWAEPKVRRVRYWDLAATKAAPGKDPDWTCGTLLSVDEFGRYYVEDVVRMRGAPLEVEQTIARTAEQDGRATSIAMEQELGSAGIHIVDHYRRKVLAGFHFKGDRMTGDKTMRASPVSSMAEPGNITVVRGPWTEAWFDELEAFPDSAHADQVDSMSGAFKMLTRKREWKAY